MSSPLPSTFIEPEFVAAQKPPLNPVSDKRGISVRSKPKTSAERTETAEDELFSTTYVPEGSSKVQDVLSLMEKHKKVLSVSRMGTKTMERAFLCLQQILQGEFLFAYVWDSAWYGRVSAKYPLERLKFDGWDSLIARIDDVLGYVEERQPYGYWFPSKKNLKGKVEKSSLADFLAKPMKSGNWWSPFLEIACGDCVTPAMLRSTLGKEVCSKLDEILQDVWFQKDFNTMVNFYRNAAALKKRQENVTRGATGEASYYFGNFLNFLEEIRKCNLETGCVGPNFIGPWSNKWSVLKGWFHKVHGVEL